MNKKGKKNITTKKEGFISRYKIQLLVISLLVFILYARTTQFSFTTLDDELLIVDNYTFINDLSNIKTVFLHDVFYNPTSVGGAGFYYRPLLTLSFMLDSQFAGEAPQYYHFVNILLHLISCLLLFRFFILLRFSSQTAFCGTVLFAVHPILSQAVGWIPGRNDSMLTLVVLASLIYFIRFLQTNKISKLCFHVLFFALAVYTKETAAALPVIILLYYFLIYRSEKIPAKNSLKTSNLITLLAGYAIVVLPWLLLRHHVVVHTAADLSFKHLSKAFIGNLPTFLQTIQKIIVPYNLSIMSVAQDTNYILSIIVIVLLIVALVLSKQKRWQYILFGFVWFCIFLLPSFFVPVLSGFEHRAYLPMVGFLIMVFEIDYFKNLKYSQPKSFAVVSVFALFFIIINFIHTGAFADNFSFWENAAGNSPHSSMAKLNYGKVLADRGRMDEAIKYYNEGLAINPNEPMIHNNLGVIYGQRKDYIDAEKEFKEETKVNPVYSDAFYNLGITCKNLGKDSEMVAALQQAIALNPNHQLAKNALYKYYQSKLEMMK